jgi:competence protein ComEA
MADSDDAPDVQPPRFRPLLRLCDQIAIAVLVGLSLLAMVVTLAWQGYFRGGVIEIDHAAPESVTFQVDINTAEWPELTLLPDVGEALARRIVEVRTADGPYRDHEDLRRRVPGIGPKKLAVMRPYLQPISPAADEERTAGSETAPP